MSVIIQTFSIVSVLNVTISYLTLIFHTHSRSTALFFIRHFSSIIKSERINGDIVRRTAFREIDRGALCVHASPNDGRLTAAGTACNVRQRIPLDCVPQK